MPLVERSFFPFADRAQLVASLDFGEGAHLEASDRGAQRLERELLRDPDVASVSAFVGRSAPLFYYNLNRHPHSAHLAQLVVSARDRADLRQLAERARELARTEVPEATLVVKRLRQGTPVDAPIELRLYGRELAALADAAERVVRGLRGIAGTRDVRDDLGRGAPVLRFEVDDAAASRHGLSHSHVARTLRERASGLVVGQYRGGRDPVPIVLTSSEGESLSIERLSLLEVGGPNGGSVSLGQIAELDVAWEPAVLRRSGAHRVVTVLADLEPGVTAQGVLDELDLSFLGLSPEIELEMGGEIEGARDAARELVRHLPLGALLMSACLLIELHSLRLVGVVLSSLLLAAAGIVPGLIVGQQPLGFMALLGVVGVGGIVVNNGIVLVDAVRRRRERGRPLEAAVRMAVVGRARSLLLTSATQLAGLFPLALSRTELWPPMAWPMITGLLASTALGLVVQPALCRLALTPRRPLA
jgi:multidrug efflux pump subunit AcrB